MNAYHFGRFYVAFSRDISLLEATEADAHRITEIPDSNGICLGKETLPDAYAYMITRYLGNGNPIWSTKLKKPKKKQKGRMRYEHQKMPVLLTDEDVASEGINQKRIDKIMPKITELIEPGEHIIVYGDDGVFFRGKEFFVITDKRIIFVNEKTRRCFAS